VPTSTKEKDMRTFTQSEFNQIQIHGNDLSLEDMIQLGLIEQVAVDTFKWM
jgi:hypothetical protein